ncbi:MAG TPA: hypothetical protein VJR89_26875 [Polyangiales bacterium]|nr:hypothetical protein [Polyangiales bacterium]
MRSVAAALFSVVCVGLGCGSDPEEPNNNAGMSGSTTAGNSAVTASGSGGTGSGVVTAGTSGGSRAGMDAPPPPAGRSGGTAGVSGAGAPAAGSGGRGAAGRNSAGTAGSTAGSGGAAAPATGEKFSFFVTSLAGMQRLSKNEQGFGGDLRYGQATGLAGADKICADLAEAAMPGAGGKSWRAFLSTAKGGMNDGPVHARDRIGQGPWYDRNGRLVAMNLNDLLQQRPVGADPAIANDLPNENGVPNHQDTMPGADDNHDTVTGSNVMGMYDNTPTCNDWTSTETPGAMGAAGSTGSMGMGGRSGGRGGMMGGRSNGPRIGHSWPAGSGMHWITAHQAPGCAPSVSLVQMGGGSGVGIGNGGGYGGFYCFSLQP